MRHIAAAILNYKHLDTRPLNTNTHCDSDREIYRAECDDNAYSIPSLAPSSFFYFNSRKVKPYKGNKAIMDSLCIKLGEWFNFELCEGF
jgi:hypothetical protein